MRHGDWAWLTILMFVVSYELACPRGELLSQAVDGYRASHPVLVWVTVLYLAGHLLRVWPATVDPLSILWSWLGR